MEKEFIEKQLRDEVEKYLNNHRDGFNEIIETDDFIRICEERNLSLVGLSNLLITQILILNDAKVKDVRIPTMASNFVSDVANDLDMHPADVIMYMYKIFSDMVVQMTVIEEIKKKNA